MCAISRAVPGWLAQWLVDRGFEQDRPSTDGISHRFRRQAPDGLGNVMFDILAPEGLSKKTDVTTIPPGRTVQTPGGTQGLHRSRRIEVGIRTSGGELVTGEVPIPDLLGALVLKAAAVGEIAVRDNPIRDWNDCALLLSMLPDPITTATALVKVDTRRLRQLTPLYDRDHAGWEGLSDADHRAGSTALHILLGD